VRQSETRDETEYNKRERIDEASARGARGQVETGRRVKSSRARGAMRAVEYNMKYSVYECYSGRVAMLYASLPTMQHDPRTRYVLPQ